MKAKAGDVFCGFLCALRCTWGFTFACFAGSGSPTWHICPHLL